ncbi:MAG: hypothetical protein R3F07_15865 [Opitutaceae bacterium]
MSTLPDPIRWKDPLTVIGRNPLAFRPDFPEVAERRKTWWRLDAVIRALDPRGPALCID